MRANRVKVAAEPIIERPHPSLRARPLPEGEVALPAVHNCSPLTTHHSTLKASNRNVGFANCDRFASASKGGIVQLTKSLAIAWAADGVRVNAIAPGWIETAMTAPLVADSDRREEIIRRTPLRRWGQPEDVAGAAIFLCSPAASFITGAVLPVDGGYSIC